MNTITSTANLSFYKVEKYHYHIKHTFDVSNCPRPHYCMGLLLEGSATFTNCVDGTKTCVAAGDIIFVPMGSKYISHWKGNPDVKYISMHFAFSTQGIFSKSQNYLLQKITPDDFESYKKIFTYALNNFDSKDLCQLKVLSDFFDILHQIQPKLKKEKENQLDPKIIKAIQYIEHNYTKKITAAELALHVQMSVSRFFPLFKKELGVTFIDYINNHRISQAILLLINDTDIGIESIAEQTGFESSAYFRRVFKKVTGLSPREYRKTAMEI